MNETKDGSGCIVTIVLATMVLIFCLMILPPSSTPSYKITHKSVDGSVSVYITKLFGIRGAFVFFNDEHGNQVEFSGDITIEKIQGVNP